MIATLRTLIRSFRRRLAVRWFLHRGIATVEHTTLVREDLSDIDIQPDGTIDPLDLRDAIYHATTDMTVNVLGVTLARASYFYRPCPNADRGCDCIHMHATVIVVDPACIQHTLIWRAAIVTLEAHEMTPAPRQRPGAWQRPDLQIVQCRAYASGWSASTLFRALDVSARACRPALPTTRAVRDGARRVRGRVNGRRRRWRSMSGGWRAWTAALRHRTATIR